MLTLIGYTTMCLKNIPPLTCYNFGIHYPIVIIFGRSLTHKARNQTMLCFPISSIWCFSITLRKRKPRRQRTAALCMQHSTTPVQRSRLPFSWTMPHKSPKLHALVTRFRKSYSSVWVVSQKDWRNQAATGWIVASTNTPSEKCNFRVSPFCQVVQKHKLFEVA